METLEPFINLMTLLTILSVVSERISNTIKFQKPELRDRSSDEAEERRREGAIQTQTVIIGILIAVIAKADMFSIVANLDAPWNTLGWVRVIGNQWFQSPATQSLGTILYALGGCILTGLALSFGSKFWHDILSTVFELRNIARVSGSNRLTNNTSSTTMDTVENGDNDVQ